jgi:hypothetical protein
MNKKGSILKMLMVESVEIKYLLFPNINWTIQYNVVGQSFLLKYKK